MKRVFRSISKLERQYIKKHHRKTLWYFLVKTGLLFPLVLLGLIEIGIKHIFGFVAKGRIKRKDKPDVVFKNIVAGFAGLAFPNEKVEALAKRRAEICASCPSAVPAGMYKLVADNRTKEIQGMKCNECGCNLSAKTRSVNDYCPLGKW